MKRVFAHIGFSFALTLIILNLVSIKWALVILSVASALFLLSLSARKVKKAVAVPLCLFCSVLACLTFISNYYGTVSKQIALNGKTANAEFYAVEAEEYNGYNYRYTVKTKSVEISGAPQNIKLYVYSDDKIDVDSYEIVKGKLKFNTIADNGFDSYGSYADNIFLKAELLNYNAKNKSVFSLNKFIIKFQTDIKNTFRKYLPKDSDGLALALVTGNKNFLNAEIEDNFKNCGASHLMAVSGLHLSIIAGSVYWLLKRLRFNKFSKAIITFSIIIFYAALAGFTKSIIRAAIMMGVILIGELFNRKSDSLNSLGIAVFLICINPYAVTDIGALLTVTAMLGVIVIYQGIIKTYSPKNSVLKYIYNAVALSFSVFTATFPVMFFSFGTVSIIGIVLNVALVPLTEFALISSVLVLLLQFCPPLLFIPLKFSAFSTKVIISLTEWFSSLSFPLLKINTFEIGLAISSVLILFGISFIIKRKGLFKITSALSVAIFIIVAVSSYCVNYNNVFVREISGYKNDAVMIYNSNNAVIIGVSEKRQYETVRSIVKSSLLNIAMIIDTKSSDYSKKLTKDASVDNYVAMPTDINAELVNCNNVLQISEFDIDLWPQLNIRYSYNIKNSGYEIKIKAYDTSFAYDNKMDKIPEDVIYTINSNGSEMRRINKWLK